MKFHKPKNIYEVVHPTQFIYKYHNLFPLTFIGHVKNGRLETTHWDILLFIFWIGLCSTLMILNMVSFSYEEIELSTKLLQTGDKIIVLIGVFMGILTNIYQLRKRENIKKFLRILNHFDDKAKTLNFQVNLTNHRKFAFLWTAISSIFLNVCVGFVTNYISAINIPEIYNPDLTKTLSYTLIIATFNLVNYQFTFASLSIRERCKVLRLNLSFYFSASTVEKDHGSSLKLYALDSIMKMHELLADAVLLVNSTFTLQLIPFTAIYFTTVLFSLHFMILNMFYFEYYDLYFTILNIYWIVVMTKVLLFSLHAGASSTEEAEKIPKFVHKAINESNDDVLVWKLKLFSQQLHHFDPQFRNKFFAINWTVLFSLIATTSTYLVIAFQSEQIVAKTSELSLESNFTEIN